MQDNKPPALTLNLFGSLEIRVHGAPLPRLQSRKSLWLLALLTLRQGKPVERDWLIGRLWPDSQQSQALAYLRQSLTELRHALADEAVRLQTPTRPTVLLDLQDAQVDVLTFDAALLDPDLSALRHAVELYRGPLMEGCTEEWILQERMLREQSYLTALQRLAEDALTRNEADVAVGYLRRVVMLDPLQEGAQRSLMQALVMEGDESAATQVYRDLRLYLHRELHSEPDPKTTALYNQLRARTRLKAQAPAELAAPRLASSPPTYRLPRPLTDLLGRETQVAEVAARLRQRRLLTLTGIGGVGKTRMAIAVADTLVDEFADGVWFVPLADALDRKGLIQSVATTLGVRDEPGRSLQETLLEYLRSKLLLLILDNCEQLIAACAAWVGELLQSCSGVRILTTSRQALGITGEVNWQVPPLSVPDLAHLPTKGADLVATASEFASVQVFVERAEALQKAFVLTSTNAGWVSRICARLDGIPLAIELAAGNVKVMSVEQIAHRLDDALRLLTRGSRTALPHQQTLRATLDWSYDLLTEGERSLLQRLAVFSGGWSLEAAEAVCAENEAVGSRQWAIGNTPQAPSPLFPDEVLDLLSSLVDKSLALAEDQTGEVRYRMLEPVRQYASERLRGSGEASEIRSRHRDYFLALAEEAAPKLSGADQAWWFDRLEREHDNLRAALELAGGETTLRLTAALWWFWMIRGYLSEGRERLATALAHPAAQDPTAARAKTLNGAGTLARQQGDTAAARSSYEAGLAVWREIGDRQGIATLLGSLGTITYMSGNLAEAQSLYEESLNLRRELGDSRGIAGLLTGLGAVSCDQGKFEEARKYYEESLTMRQEFEDRLGVARSLGSLGVMAGKQGDYHTARRFFEEGLIVRRELRDRQGIAWSLDNLGNVATALGEYESAQAFYEESLEIQRELGDRQGIAGSLYGLGTVAFRLDEPVLSRSLHRESLAIRQEVGDQVDMIASLEAFAQLAAGEGQLKCAVTLWAAVVTLHETLGSRMESAVQSDHDHDLNSLRESLPKQIFAEAWSEGCALPLNQVIALALDSS